MKVILYVLFVTGLIASAYAGDDLLWLKGGHASKVGAVAWSPDGTLIASASDDSTVKLWSTNGVLMRTLSVHPYQATTIAFSSTGTKLAVGTYAGGYSFGSNGLGRVLLWQATNGWAGTNVTLTWSMTNRFGKITTLAFSPDSLCIAAGNSSGSNVVRRVSDGAVLAQFAAYYDPTVVAPLNSLAFSSGGLLASGCDDGCLRVWNSSWLQILKTNNIHTSNISAVAFSPDGSVLASASSDQTIRIWSITNWSLLGTFTGHTSGVTCISYSPDATTLASGSLDGTIKLWSIANATCRETIAAHADMVASVAISPDGKCVASGGQDNDLKIWSTTDGALLQVFGGHADLVKAVAISSDSSLCASASNDKTIQIRDLTSGILTAVLPGHTGCVSAMAFAPDSAVLASGGGPLDPTIKFWRLADRELLRTIYTGTSGVMALAFSPDGSVVASGGDFDEQVIRLWNVEDGTSAQTLPGHSNGVTALAFSPIGDLIASGGRRFDNTVKVWPLTNGSRVRKFTGHSNNIEAIAFAEDGDKIASGSSGTNALRIWKVSDGSSRIIGNDTNPVFFVAFSPDGNVLAAASKDAIQLWSVVSGTLIQTITQETFRVSCLAYSPNGNLFMLGREDATVAVVCNTLGALGQPSLVFNRITIGDEGRTILQATVQPKTHYVVRYSENLTNWTPLGITFPRTNSVQITYAVANALSFRFYRAVTPP